VVEKVEVAGHLHPTVHLPVEDTTGTYSVGLFQAMNSIGGEVIRIVEDIATLYGEPIP
jgi:hypothetical protein